MTDAPDATVSATAPPGGSATASVSPAPQTVTKTVEHSQPSNLPELHWLYRRIFVFALTGCTCALFWRITERVNDVGLLRLAVQGCIGLIFFLVLAYVIGASAEKVVEIISAVRTTRRETITTGGPPSA